MLLCLQERCSKLLHGKAEYHHSGVMTLLLFAEDHHVGYDGYKSRLRTKRVALVANGLICGQAERCGNNRGKLKTTRVLWWLQR